jgi:hypothetical protein
MTWPSDHSCFQWFGCQHFGKTEAIVISTVAANLAVVTARHGAWLGHQQDVMPPPRMSNKLEEWIMPSFEPRTLLDAFALASGAPPVAWQATDALEIAAGEAGEKSPNVPSASRRQRDTDRQVMPQYDIEYWRRPWLG